MDEVEAALAVTRAVVAGAGATPPTPEERIQLVDALFIYTPKLDRVKTACTRAPGHPPMDLTEFYYREAPILLMAVGAYAESDVVSELLRHPGMTTPGVLEAVPQSVFAPGVPPGVHHGRGETALMLAVRQGNFEVASLLLASGASPLAARLDNGDTVLHCVGANTVFSHEQEQCAKVVIDFCLATGQPLDVPNLVGETPIAAARRRRHDGVVHLFEAAGVKE